MDRRKVAANFIALSTSGILGLLLGIFTSVYSRRVLGPFVIGQVSWNAALLDYLGAIVSRALQLVGQRDIAKDPAETARLASLIVTMQMLFALMAYGVIGVLAALNLRGPQVGALLLLQGIGLLVAAANVRWVLQAHERMVAPSIVAFVLNVLQIPALVALIHRPEDVFIYVVYTVPFALLGVAYNFWYLDRHGLLKLGELRPTLAGARRMLAEAWPVALSQGGILLYYNCDAVILGFARGNEAVGLYSTAYKLMLVATVISGAMWAAYFPVITRVQAIPYEAARVGRECVTLLAWTGVPIAALGWASGRHLVTLMYGAEFAESGLYFEWLCLDIALIFINTGLGMPLLAWGFQRTRLKITVPVGLGNLALNLLLIPSYGAWGAIATTIGAELSMLVLLIIVRRRLAIGWHPLAPMIAPPLLCSASVALGIKMLPEALAQYWWVEAVIGVIVLGGCLLALERRILTTALKLLRKA